MTLIDYKDDTAHVEQVSLESIRDTFGTPTFVYSHAAIEASFRRFQEAFAGTDHRICYAVKANSNLGVLSLLNHLGSGFDIVSAGELQRVLEVGAPASRVVYSGVGKRENELEAALAAGIGCFNVESPSELARLERVAGRMDRVAPVSVRVNPDVDARTHPYISTGLAENKFGVPVEDAHAMYEQVRRSKHLHATGIDCHIGSQITEIAPFLDAAERVLALVDDLEKAGTTLEHIDLGGGMGVNYHDNAELPLESYADALRQQLGHRKLTLVFEPGRFIVANAGLLLTEVTTLKANGERHFAVVDAAMNDLIRPSLYSAWQDILPVRQSDAQPATYDVVGPICETGDFLGKARQLAIREGDLLSVMGAGAYGFAMSSNYNSRPRAAEIMVSGSEMHCIRDRETIADLYRHEHLYKP